jgi:hypothetical protein
MGPCSSAGRAVWPRASWRRGSVSVCFRMQGPAVARCAQFDRGQAGGGAACPWAPSPLCSSLWPSPVSKSLLCLLSGRAKHRVGSLEALAMPVPAVVDSRRKSCSACCWYQRRWCQRASCSFLEASSRFHLPYPVEFV